MICTWGCTSSPCSSQVLSQMVLHSFEQLRIAPLINVIPKYYFIFHICLVHDQQICSTHSFIRRISIMQRNVIIISFSKWYPYYQPHVLEFNYQQAHNRITSNVCDCEHWKHGSETDFSRFCLRRIPHDTCVVYLKRGENETNVKRRDFFIADLISKDAQKVGLRRRVIWLIPRLSNTQ